MPRDIKLMHQKYLERKKNIVEVRRKGGMKGQEAKRKVIINLGQITGSEPTQQEQYNLMDMDDRNGDRSLECMDEVIPLPLEMDMDLDNVFDAADRGSADEILEAKNMVREAMNNSLVNENECLNEDAVPNVHKEIQVRFDEPMVDVEKIRLREENTRLNNRIKDLEEENAKLRQQIRIQAASKPHKTFEEITQRQLKRRAQQITEFVKTQSPSIQPGSPATSSLMRSVRRNLGVFSPLKKMMGPEKCAPTEAKFSPEVDLFITLRSGISFHQRKELKRQFLLKGIECWASDNRVEKLKKELSAHGDIEWVGTSQRRTLIFSNVALLLKHRIQALFKNGLLHLRTPGIVSVVLTGDKGGEKGSTKFGFVLVDVDTANAPNNFTLLALYNGDDDRKNLERLEPILDQLRELKEIEVEQKILKVELFFCSDMKFCAAFYGHRGASAGHPCVVCLAKKGELGPEIVHERTLEQMNADAISGTHSMAAKPLLDIPPANIIPPTLHIMMGVSQRIIDLLEAEIPEENAESLRRWFSENHCKKNPRSMNFTGNAIYKMLNGANPDELTAMLPASELRDVLVQIMWSLQAICTLSQARMLNDEDLEKLDKRINEFFYRWKWLATLDPKTATITPKVHWLVAHLAAFAKSRHWIAIVSEQSIEHVHSHFDRLEIRYTNTGNEEMTLLKLARHQLMLNGLHDQGFGGDESAKK